MDLNIYLSFKILFLMSLISQIYTEEEKSLKGLYHRIRIKVGSGLRRGTWSESAAANSYDKSESGEQLSLNQNRNVRQSDYYYRPPYRRPVQPYYPYDDSEDLEQASYYDRIPYNTPYYPPPQPYYRYTTTTTTTTTTPNPLNPIGYMLIDTYHAPGGATYSQPIAYYKV